MNKKGQVLVAFLLFLPLLFLFMSYFVDRGILAYQKRKIESTVSTTLYGALDHLGDSEAELSALVHNLLKKNIENLEVSVQIQQVVFHVQVKKRLEGLFDFIFSSNHLFICNYVAYIEQDQKIIKKE